MSKEGSSQVRRRGGDLEEELPLRPQNQNQNLNESLSYEVEDIDVEDGRARRVENREGRDGGKLDLDEKSFR